MESYFRGTEVNIENANKKVLISKKKKKKGSLGWSTIEEHVLEKSHFGVFPKTS